MFAVPDAVLEPLELGEAVAVPLLDAVPVLVEEPVVLAVPVVDAAALDALPVDVASVEAAELLPEDGVARTEDRMSNWGV